MNITVTSLSCKQTWKLTKDAELARSLFGRDHLHVGLQMLNLNHWVIRVVRAGDSQLHVMTEQ